MAGCPGKLVDFQGSHLSSSGTVHPDVQEIKQRWSKASVDEKETPDKNETWGEAYGRVKQGQETQQEYKGTVQACRIRIRKANPHLEVNLARDVKGNKKGFHKYSSSKKGKLGKMMALCWMGQKTWWQGHAEDWATQCPLHLGLCW